MKKKIKLMIPYLLISIILIVGIIIKVYADYLYNSNDVYYENNSSTLSSTDLQSAIEELDTKCENRIAASQQCPEGYKCTEIPYICKRATTLHTENCNSDTSVTTAYCRGDGYSAGSKITYGQLGTKGSEPSPGDAFDCDVTGTGNRERFYYVSKYYDTSSKSFNNNYYVFIYYSNTSSGVADTSHTVAWYASSNSNSYGPTTARAQLPTTSQWRNDLLKTRTRNILDGTGSVIKSNFSYEGYAARLLTVQELKSACPNASQTIGSMSGCNYFLEQTTYSTNSYAVYGSWLESAFSTTHGWIVNSYQRTATNNYVSGSSNYSVRPVIEVNKNDVSY